MIPVNTPLLNGNEKKYLNECIDTGWISSEGPFIAEFEKKFAARMNRKHGIAVNNGTAAIDAAVEALGIGPGDEVILPAFTIISCVTQIVRAGAVPVVIDSDPNTWNIDVNKIEEKITAKTRAIMIVHIYGLPVDVDPVLELAKKYNLKIIEDAAEMHGQEYKGKNCGSFGDISTFSFYPNKHITTGEGGMILTDDDELADTCRSLRNLCFRPEERFVHDRLGWNLRMTNLQAAIGLAQLERLDEFVSIKRKMGSIYNDEFKNIEEVQLPLEKTSYGKNIYWVYGLIIKDESKIDAKGMMNKLSIAGIGTRPFFYPMNKQPVLRKMGFFDGVDMPVAQKMYKQGFYIPSGLGLTEEDLERSAKIVKKTLMDSLK